MTLQEFIMDTFAANMIEFDEQKAKDMEKEITNYAKKKARGSSSVAISDEEIREFILNSKDMLKRLDEDRKKQEKENEKRNKEQQQRWAEMRSKAREEKEKASDSQMYSLFDE